MTSKTTPGWRDVLGKTATLLDRTDKDRKKASAMLWLGAKECITEWVDSGADPDGEVMYGTIIDILGAKRKGDASKVRTVAMAVKSHSLDTGRFDNLSKAYNEAIRLTKKAVEQENEDAAIDQIIDDLAKTAPDTAQTPEGAALLLLSKGVDGAVVAILDALNGPHKGINNSDAHRAFLRAVTTEIAARQTAAAKQTVPSAPAKPVPSASAKAAPKAEAVESPQAEPAKVKTAAAKQADDKPLFSQPVQSAPESSARPVAVKRPAVRRPVKN